MEQWHIEGVREYDNGKLPGVVRWRWRRVGSHGEVIAKAGRTFDDIERCLKDARKHGYCAGLRRSTKE